MSSVGPVQEEYRDRFRLLFIRHCRESRSRTLIVGQYRWKVTGFVQLTGSGFGYLVFSMEWGSLVTVLTSPSFLNPVCYVRVIRFNHTLHFVFDPEACCSSHGDGVRCDRGVTDLRLFDLRSTQGPLSRSCRRVRDCPFPLFGSYGVTRYVYILSFGVKPKGLQTRGVSDLRLRPLVASSGERNPLLCKQLPFFTLCR